MREGDAFFFETPSGDTVERLTVRWTIGVTPLQQYLVERDGGRWQAFTWVWDARPAPAGGQRWYFLYADQPPAVVEANHWDGARQNANHQCVACHAVDFEKGVDAATGELTSRMAEPGPGFAAMVTLLAGLVRRLASDVADLGQAAGPAQAAE